MNEINQEPDAASQMRAITISREYGSGGGEIATRLAGRLGWQLIDHEVIVQVAHELGVSEAEAEEHDERVEGLVERILKGMQLFEPAALVSAPILPVVTDSRSYQEALRRVVEATAATGHVVIVGRGSQVLLARRRDVLHARIVAPLDPRIAYVMVREGLDQAAARARIQLKDRDRVRYLQEVHNRNPHDADLYDIVVNTGVLDLESAVDLIYLALQRKARQLTTPTKALGPGAGLARYPGQPGDFRPPEHLTEQSQ
jgi:cytidylate kinase